MIYADGVYRVIEVNPRVSGTTTISIAASGVNTYIELTKMLLGVWRGETCFLLPAQRWVFEFPIEEFDYDKLARLRNEISVIRANKYHYLGKPHSSIILSCPHGDEEVFLGRFLECIGNTGLMIPSILPVIHEILQ